MTQVPASQPDLELIKLLYLGDSGAGKTGSLASLLDMGLNVRMLDLENGSQILTSKGGVLLGANSKYKPDCISRLCVIKLTEEMRVAGGKLIPKSAIVWDRAMNLLMNWKYTNSVNGQPVDYGPITNWTSNDVVVIDSLTALAKAAMRFHLALNGRLAGSDGNEYRRDVWAAQKLVEDFLDMISSPAVKCNVVINCHIQYVNDPEAPPPMPNEERKKKGYANTVGNAIASKVARGFNSALRIQTDGAGSGASKRIYTKSQGLVELKTPVPNAVKPYYPIETGLADYFKVVRGS